MKRFFIFLTAAVSVLAALTGCRTDHTKSAVERARTYALKNLTGLTDGQRNFIRFTQPEIYENIVYPRYVIPLNTGSGHIEVDDVRHFPVAPGEALANDVMPIASVPVNSHKRVSSTGIASEGLHLFIILKPRNDISVR